MKCKFCALLLTLVMAMSAAACFSACGGEKPSEDLNATDPSGGGQGGQPKTPPAEEKATEGLHYTSIYGEDGTAVGYTVGAGEAAEEENIVIPAKQHGRST